MVLGFYVFSFLAPHCPVVPLRFYGPGALAGTFPVVLRIVNYLKPVFCHWFQIIYNTTFIQPWTSIIGC
jgi:hypothetical protein